MTVIGQRVSQIDLHILAVEKRLTEYDNRGLLFPFLLGTVDTNKWARKNDVLRSHFLQLFLGSAQFASGNECVGRRSGESEPCSERKKSLQNEVLPMASRLIGLIGSLFIWIIAARSGKNFLRFSPLFLIGLLFFYLMAGYGGSELLTCF